MVGEEVGSHPAQGRLLGDRLRPVLAELRPVGLGGIGPGTARAVETALLVHLEQRQQAAPDAHLGAGSGDGLPDRGDTRRPVLRLPDLDARVPVVVPGCLRDHRLHLPTPPASLCRSRRSRPRDRRCAQRLSGTRLAPSSPLRRAGAREACERGWPGTAEAVRGRDQRMAYDYDLLVVGSGPGGHRAAIAAAKLGRRVGDRRPPPRWWAASASTPARSRARLCVKPSCTSPAWPSGTCTARATGSRTTSRSAT